LQKGNQMKSRANKQAGKSSRRRARAAQSAAQPPAAQAEERRAYLTGRVLRDADEEACKAFADLIADTARPELRDEVLTYCELAARVLDAQSAARALPAIDYEPLVLAREPEIAARTSVDDLAPEYRNDKHKTRLVAQRLDGLRERIAEWRALGEFYADALDSPYGTATGHNVLMDELDGLASDADLYITHPDVLRLLYPLLRLRAAARERAAIAAQAEAQG
jgi:hypothetical protein